MEQAKKNGVRYGLIFAAIAVLYSYGGWVFNEAILAKWWLSLVLMLFGMTIFVFASIKTKKDLSGYISFQESFSAFMIASIVYMAIGTVANILLFQVLDTDLGNRLNEYIIIQTLEWFERMNMPEDQIGEALARMEGQDNFSIKAQIKSLFGGILFFAVVGSISSAIIKKKRPMWQNEGTLDSES